MNIFRRKKILELAKDLATKCEELNIWYAITDATLLGAVRHGGFVPWVEKFQINILPGGLRKLKSYYPSHVIDSSKDKKYNKLTAAWVPSDRAWETSNVFVEIKVLVPTTTNKIKKLHNPFKLFADRLTFKKLDIKYMLNNLIDTKKYQGYIELENFYQKNKFNWHQTYSFETLDFKMNGISFKAPREFNKILKLKYGDDYMKKVDVPFYWEVFHNAVKTVKVS